MSQKTKKISVDGDRVLENLPFAALDFPTLSSTGNPDAAPVATPNNTPPSPRKRGKVHLRIEKAGRGGKTVTVLFGPGVEAMSVPERTAMLRSLKQALGVGGCLGDANTLEVQGDERTRVAAWLAQTGF